MFFCFWVITWSQELGFGRNLVDFFPRGLPDLSKQLRDQNNRKKYKQNEIQNFEKLIFLIFGPNWRFPDMRGCAIGGFRPVESESEVKNWKFRQLESKNWTRKFQNISKKNEKILRNPCINRFILCFLLAYLFPIYPLGYSQPSPDQGST